MNTYRKHFEYLEENSSKDNKLKSVIRQTHFIDQMQGDIDQRVQRGIELFKQAGLKVGDILYTPKGNAIEIVSQGIRVDKNGESLIYGKNITTADKTGEESSAYYLNQLSYDAPLDNFINRI